MADKSFRQELLEAWEAIRESRGDGKISFSEWLKIIGETCGAMERLCVQYGGDDTEFNQLVLDCEWFTQTYLVPLDLPIKDFIENNFVDPYLVAAVRPLLLAARPKK